MKLLLVLSVGLVALAALQVPAVKSQGENDDSTLEMAIEQILADIAMGNLDNLTEILNSTLDSTTGGVNQTLLVTVSIVNATTDGINQLLEGIKGSTMSIFVKVTIGAIQGAFQEFSTQINKLLGQAADQGNEALTEVANMALNGIVLAEGLVTGTGGSVSGVNKRLQDAIDTIQGFLGN